MVLLEPFCLRSNLFCCWLYICQSCLYSDWSHLGRLELPQSFEPGQEKMCLMSYANNKGADQPAHLCSLISAFIVHCLYSISRFYSQNFKTLASFCGCAGQFVSRQVGNSRRHVLSWRGSFFMFFQFCGVLSVFFILYILESSNCM